MLFFDDETSTKKLDNKSIKRENFTKVKQRRET